MDEKLFQRFKTTITSRKKINSLAEWIKYMNCENPNLSDDSTLISACSSLTKPTVHHYWEHIMKVCHPTSVCYRVKRQVLASQLKAHPIDPKDIRYKIYMKSPDDLNNYINLVNNLSRREDIENNLDNMKEVLNQDFNMITEKVSRYQKVLIKCKQEIINLALVASETDLIEDLTDDLKMYEEEVKTLLTNISDLNYLDGNKENNKSAKISIEETLKSLHKFDNEMKLFTDTIQEKQLSLVHDTNEIFYSVHDKQVEIFNLDDDSEELEQVESLINSKLKKMGLDGNLSSCFKTIDEMISENDISLIKSNDKLSDESISDYQMGIEKIKSLQTRLSEVVVLNTDELICVMEEINQSKDDFRKNMKFLDESFKQFSSLSIKLHMLKIPARGVQSRTIYVPECLKNYQNDLEEMKKIIFQVPSAECLEECPRNRRSSNRKQSIDQFNDSMHTLNQTVCENLYSGEIIEDLQSKLIEMNDCLQFLLHNAYLKRNNKMLMECVKVADSFNDSVLKGEINECLMEFDRLH